MKCSGCPQLSLHRCKVSGVPETLITSCPENRWGIGPLTVDVIITCHNYAKYLNPCLLSIKSQTHLGKVILVNDASSDNTCFFASAVDTYLEIDEHHPQAGHQIGLTHTVSPFVLFMDADNFLSPGYLSAALEKFVANPRLAICYPDLQFFEERIGALGVPTTFNAARFEQENFIDTCSVFRKEALLQTSALPYRTVSHDDWYNWTKVLQSGLWEAELLPISLNYRVHKGQLLDTYRKQPYRFQCNFDDETVTVFTTYSKRVALSPALWQRRLSWLSSQTWPNIRLVVANTSGEPNPPLPTHLVGVSVYTHNLTPGLELLPRIGKLGTQQQIQTAVASIYNRMFKEVSSRLILVVEDDTFCDAPDLISRLIDSFDKDTCAVTTGYKLRYPPYPYCVWYGRKSGTPDLRLDKGSGVEVIGGSGLGTILLRREMVASPLYGNAETSPWYDVNFWYNIPYKVKVDWTLDTEHVEA